MIRSTPERTCRRSRRPDGRCGCVGDGGEPAVQLISTAASREAARRPVIEPAPAEAGGWLRRMGPYLAVHRGRIIVAVGASVLGQVVVALTPVIEKTIVDETLVSSTRPIAPLITLLVVAGVLAF